MCSDQHENVRGPRGVSRLIVICYSITGIIANTRLITGFLLKQVHIYIYDIYYCEFSSRWFFFILSMKAATQLVLHIHRALSLFYID